MDKNSSHPDPIHALADQFVGLQQRAMDVYEPIVTSIIEARSTDKHFIESTLDGLLGFAGSDDGLVLYRKLCRYFWELDPEATASCVLAYRDMWESEPEGDQDCRADN